MIKGQNFKLLCTDQTLHLSVPLLYACNKIRLSHNETLDISHTLHHIQLRKKQGLSVHGIMNTSGISRVLQV